MTFFISYFLLSVISFQNNTDTYTLTITVDGIESNEGQIIINLHNEETTFPKKYLLRKFGSINNKTSIVSFNNIPRGVYAISVIHDSNKNGEMDFNFLHIPTEKTGASNNAKGYFGPPTFNDAKFRISENLKILINL